MNCVDFEWDEAKAEANYARHGVDFWAGVEAVNDLFAIGRKDPRSGAYGEERFLITVMGNGKTDGKLVRVHPDGREEAMTGRPIRPMSEAEVEAAALADPDARPLSDEELARSKPVPRARTLRRALGLTQEEFAARYHIPVGTLRDWEQGRAAPDQPARAYLRAIAGDPKGVLRALEASPH